VDLTVRVLEEPGGAGFADAAVLVYWGEMSTPGAPEASEPWTRVDPEPATPEADHVLRMRTGIDGEAVAKVPEDERVGVLTSAEDRTEEWIPALRVGSSDETVELPLYDRRRTVTHQVTVGPATTTRGNQPGWHPVAVKWTTGGDHRAAYLRRMVSLEANLTWESSADGGGDLALGLSVNESEPDVVQDEGDETSPGRHREELTLDVEEVEELGWPDEDVLRAGPATRSAGVAPQGLETEVTLEGIFSPFPADAGYPPFGATGSGDGSSSAVPSPVWLVLAGGAVGAAAAQVRPGRRR
jgi:hypothetical protein